MIDLRTALIIAGVILFIVIVVISYDRYRLSGIRGKAEKLRESDVDWQEPSLGRLEEEEFESVLPNEPGHTVLSPEVDSTEHITSPEEDELDQEIRDAQDLAHTPIHGMDIKAVAAGKLSDKDIEIDFVARIPGKNIIKRDTALGLYRQYDFELHKRHRIFGLSYPSNVWVDLEREQESARFTHFGMTIQLVDRRGAITESELNQFTQLVLRFTEVFGRRFSFSMKFEEALEHAKTLDELCKKYDALAILNIVAPTGRKFPGGDIHSCASELGMMTSQRNVYEKRKASGIGSQVLYGLANASGDSEFDVDNIEDFRTEGLTLFMNIPATSKPAETFELMVKDALFLCERLGGRLVDQKGKPMSDEGLEQIGRQIRTIEREMQNENLVPGGALAVRLF